MSGAKLFVLVLRAKRVRVDAPSKESCGDAARWPLNSDRWIYEEAHVIRKRGEAPSIRSACKLLAARFLKENPALINSRGDRRVGTTAGKLDMAGEQLHERLQYYRRRLKKAEATVTCSPSGRIGSLIDLRNREFSAHRHH
jgi:hypothetical protein